ncbi:MAG: right-handed parallel beta-helix repeat-containing protein, partial [Planctomycetota bacterium]
DFEVEDPKDVRAMTLFIDYDDAYVAYINGTEVARSASAPPGTIFFDDTAFDSREAVSGGDLSHEGVESIDVSTALADLVPGRNVLAVVGINDTLDSRDFSLLCGLDVESRVEGEGLSGGCGSLVFAQGDSLRLRGFTDPVRTRSVRVEGEESTLEFVTEGNGPFGLRWERVTGLVPDSDQNLRVAAYTDEDDLIDDLDMRVRGLSRGFEVLRGEISSDAIWRPELGPYRLSGEVVVAEGATLEVRPGTKIFADGEASIRVRGRILAIGSDSEAIEWNSLSCDRAWGGILLEGIATQHVFRHNIFRGGAGVATADGFLRAESTQLLVEDSIFIEIASNAIDAIDSRVEIRGSAFRRVYEGGHFTDSIARIEDCEFVSLLGDRDALDFDGSNGQRSSVRSCVFEGITDDGIDAGNIALTVDSCIFRGISDKALSLEGRGLGDVIVERNLIYDCGTGLSIKNEAQVVGGHNTIALCDEGISVVAKESAVVGGRATLHSTIVWGNRSDIVVDAASRLAIDHTLSASGYPGVGNLAGDPRFRDLENRDFSLAPGSPCIDAGRDGEDIGAIPFDGPSPGTFLRGDANESGRVDISEAIAVLNFLFLGADGPACRDRLDADDNGNVNITDGIVVLNYLFGGGDPFPPPFPQPGFDPSEDALPCP